MNSFEVSTIVLSLFSFIAIGYLIIKLLNLIILRRIATLLCTMNRGAYIVSDTKKCLMCKKGITVHGEQCFFCLGTGKKTEIERI